MPVPRRMIRHLCACLAILVVVAPDDTARADREPPVAAIGHSQIDAGSKPVTPRSDADRLTGKGADQNSKGGGSWWLSTAGVALLLAVVGWGSFVSRKYLPKSVLANTKGMKVIGRTSLSPKHSVYLLQVGERVLIVGAGPQGAPSLLGEWSDSDRRTDAEATASTTPPGRFDHRIGDGLS